MYSPSQTDWQPALAEWSRTVFLAAAADAPATLVALLVGKVSPDSFGGGRTRQ